MANHLHVIASRQRSAVAEVIHDKTLRDFANVKQPAYDAFVEDLVRCRETDCFAPADRSTVRVLGTGRMAMVNPIRRADGMPKHDASDVLYVLLDKCWEREPAKPDSARARLYREITQRVFDACTRHGLPIPENNPVVGIAIERAGIDPSTVPLVPVEEPETQFLPAALRARMPDVTPLRARALGLIERGGNHAVHTALVEAEIDR